MEQFHPMWLPAEATAALRGRTVSIGAMHGLGAHLRATLIDEVRAAGMTVVDAATEASTTAPEVAISVVGDGAAGSYTLHRVGGSIRAVAADGAGALYAWFHIVRLGRAAFEPAAEERCAPAHELRMLDHWDNVEVHPVMGQVERGYAGGSIFFDAGVVREDLTRVHAYARLLASIGIDRIAINNVNVTRRAARLLTDDLPKVARIAEVLRAWGIRLHLSVSFASPILLGGSATADPLEPAVAEWWRAAFDWVYEQIPDFGGVVVKADSEGQPGPFAYGRHHADGANMLAAAIRPHGGLVHWRAFVYDHRQDWRDRSTDRARAAHDHFTPLDGTFDEGVVLQVKYGPMDFQTREPISPVLFALPRTRVALELQVTQEYTGQQRHAVYLAPQWREILDFRREGEGGPALAELVDGGMAAVANIGDDAFWTGHPLAQANLYAYGRLCWAPTLDAAEILDEWITLTFGTDPVLRAALHEILDDSWRVYESYTAPLGVGFMVTPGSHYGPSVDGYEYSPWGTYHFADRDGIGVDRTVATGTGYAGLYPEPWAGRYEQLQTCPEELLLFFHHVPYSHRLSSGATIAQHVYDTHADGAAAAAEKERIWATLAGRMPQPVFERGAERFAEQTRSAAEWRDQISTYFLRHSGIADAHDRVHP